MPANLRGPHYAGGHVLDELTDGSTELRDHGWYFTAIDDAGDLLDVAGPFDARDECELAMRRAEAL